MNGPTDIRNRIVGGALRRYREAIGFNLGDAAEILECDRSKLSRVETGQRGINSRELLLILGEYGAAEEARNTLTAIASRKGWWKKHSPPVPRANIELAALMSCAHRISVYEAHQIPLLVQTLAYAYAVAGSDRSLTPQTREAIPEMTPELQKIVLNTGTAHIRLVVGEAALLQQTGGIDVMLPQLRRLGTLEARPEVRVVPLRSISHPAAWAGSMTLLEFDGVPGLTGVVHLGGPNGGLFLDDADTVDSCVRVFSELRAAAVTGDAATGLIDQAVLSCA